MRTALKMLLGLSAKHGSAYVDEPIVYLLHDDFVGSGDLEAHNPSGEWYWDNWTAGGHTGSAWAVAGGAVSQTDYPTGGEGVRSYFAHIQAATSDPLVTCTILSPASGTWRNGVIVRRTSDTVYWLVRLNSSNNRLELVQIAAGSETVRDFEAFTCANNTQYTIVVDCNSDTITGTVNATSVTWTSSTGQDRMSVGLHERIALNDGHATFLDFKVEHSPSAGTTASRLLYAPGDAAVSVEWDSEANSGVADTTVVNGFFNLEIDTTSGTAGTRPQWNCDANGQRPAVESATAIKNLPDKMWFTDYKYITDQIERTGSFWNIMQFKQRDTTAATSPTLSLNLGWNGSAMVTEINNNIDSDGSYNGDMPDLSTTSHLFPIDQWVRIDIYYHWHATSGRLRVFMDNVELYDFQGIRTMFSAPDDGTWDAPQCPRVATIAHYSDGLNPANTTIYSKNASINVGDRLPDNYPVAPPV